jgi:hypothetical protein
VHAAFVVLGWCRQTAHCSKASEHTSYAGGKTLTADGTLCAASLPSPVAPTPPSHAQLARPDQLPATTCSKQWTLTTLLQIPSGAWDYSLALDIPVLALQAPGTAPSTAASVSAGLPGLLLRVNPGSGSSSKGNVVLVVIMAGRERWMDITAGLPDGTGNKGSAGLHIALVRDGNRLGVWGNGVGGWVLQDVGCLPANPFVTYCTATSTGTSWAVGAAQLGQAGASSRGVRAAYLRMYNYALPKWVTWAPAAPVALYGAPAFKASTG